MEYLEYLEWNTWNTWKNADGKTMEYLEYLENVAPRNRNGIGNGMEWNGILEVFHSNSIPFRNT